jgi:hypothetical protein
MSEPAEVTHHVFQKPNGRWFVLVPPGHEHNGQRASWREIEADDSRTASGAFARRAVEAYKAALHPDSIEAYCYHARALQAACDATDAAYEDATFRGPEESTSDFLYRLNEAERAHDDAQSRFSDWMTAGAFVFPAAHHAWMYNDDKRRP